MELTTLHRNGLRFVLEEKGQSGPNRFTVIIGPNGSGKSRLLRAIVDHVSEPVEGTSLNSHTVGATSVAAISNLITDSFPFARASAPNYRYLGIRQSNNAATTGALRDLTAQAVALSLGEPWRAQPVFGAVNLLGFRDFSVAFVGAKRPTRKDKLASALEWELRGHELSAGQVVERLYDGLVEIQGSLSTLRHSSQAESQRRMRQVQTLSDALAIDAHALLRIAKRTGFFDLELAVHDGDRWVADHELSTGQLLLLSLVARVAAFVQPNSLVLVDEPETALHPTWQSALVQLIRESLPSELSSHFFLATHSPYVVADGSDLLVPSEQWGHFEEYPEHFWGRSPENLLYRAFRARVTGNSAVDEDLLLVAETVGARQRPEDIGPARGAIRRLRAIAGDDTPSLNAMLDDALDSLEIG